MTTLSLAMIVKNEGATIERALSCAKLFSDEMVVVDTGSTDDTVARAKAMGASVHPFAWIDDFATARNFSFSQCTRDWIIWLDGDDVISPDNQERILELKHSVLNDDLQAIYLRYVYPPFQQWRERMARRDLFVEGRLRWKEPIHEFIDGIDGQKTRYFDNIAIVHATPPDRHALKKDRNISILRKHFNSGATDDRSLYIYAVECLHSLLKDEGEQVLARFFSQVKIPEYRYEIYCKTYNFHMHFSEPQRALEALSKAIIEDPSRAEAFYKLGRAPQRDRPAGSSHSPARARQHDPHARLRNPGGGSLYLRSMGIARPCAFSPRAMGSREPIGEKGARAQSTADAMARGTCALVRG